MTLQVHYGLIFLRIRSVKLHPVLGIGPLYIWNSKFPGYCEGNSYQNIIRTGMEKQYISGLDENETTIT